MTDATMDLTPEPSKESASRGLFSASFLGLLLTQLLTAANDNAFRWLVIGIGKQSLERSGTPENIGFILTAGTACFVLPYLVLAAPAGYLADRYSKRQVIVACKVAEIVIMTLGVLAILTDNLGLLFAVVAMMGAQSALFSPAKLGSIPEMLAADKISAANGMIGLTTVISTVVGMAVGNLLADLVREDYATGVILSAAALIGIAVIGWMFSLLIAKLKPANPARTFPWDAGRQTIRDLRTLASNRALLRVALGVMFFWSVGALAQLNIDQFAFEGGARYQSDIVPLLLALVAGVGLGSVLAGIWSAGRVELGILPLGAGGVALNAMLLFLVGGELITPDSSWTASYVWAGLLLFFLGMSAGLFDVPLASFMQHRSPPESRGAVLAASNFLTFAGILVTAILYSGLRLPVRGEPLFSSGEIFLMCGLGTIPVFIYIVWLIPQASIRFVVWMTSKLVYRIRVVDRHHLPETGGALLVANHVSWLDGVLMLLTSSRPVRIVAFDGNFSSPWTRRLARLFGVIMIGPGPKAITGALETAREALKRGELVCVFPEGEITRTGELQPFKPGLLKILDGVDVPVVPIYLDELWGSIFSFEGGKFFWKFPKRWPYPISIYFGKALTGIRDVQQVEQAVEDLSGYAMEKRMTRNLGLARQFVRTCKRRTRGAKIQDSTGIEMSGGSLLLRSLILRRLLRRHVLDADEEFVGLLLPPAVAAVVGNMSLALDRRVAVNLNYSVTSDVINACIDQAGIRHVLTSRKFTEKLNLNIRAHLVYLEDLRVKPTLGDKLMSMAATYLLPAWLLERMLGLHRVKPDDLATVIFTSGSTGEPKGVMLTQENIGSNVTAFQQVLRLNYEDVLVGILPFFHSFGYTATLWTIMTIDARGAYHFNPLDARQVGKLCKKSGATVLLATPTFLRTYTRRCEPDQFASLDVVITGAERLPVDVADAFEERFGIRPLEGYGTTEVSPVVSVNISKTRAVNSHQVTSKQGTVGRPIPGVRAKVTALATGEDLPCGKPGMLWIKGPNVMRGYLGREELTDQVIRQGWYRTGDLASLDEDGFISITGRESRFSKIGGEMVPHIKIEEIMARCVGSGEDGLRVAVTAVPDAKKGERLIVLHSAIDKTPAQLRAALVEAGLPNLFIPSEDSFLQIEHLPILGTGKLDLKGLRDIALHAFASRSAE